MPKLGAPDKRGDLYARVKVRLPQEPDEDERELFEQLKEAGVRGGQTVASGKQPSVRVEACLAPYGPKRGSAGAAPFESLRAGSRCAAPLGREHER